MITFKQFVNESSAKEFDLEKFKIDCAPILKQLKGGNGSFLYHGTTNVPSSDWEIRSFKQREKPRDSDIDLHVRLNAFFTEKFGGPVRNWLFTTGVRNDALMYSQRNIDGILAIFPIGDFEWVCGLDDDLHDLTGWYNRAAMQIRKADVTGAISYEQSDKLAINFMLSKMAHMKWNHNTNLLECINSTNEIHVKCDKFYVFKTHESLFQDVIKPFVGSL